MRKTGPEIQISPVDISPFQAGTGSIPYVHEITGDRPGPTALISAIVHGNELCGAIALESLLRANFKPRCGTLILAFMNIDAYRSFDKNDPARSRYIDEDFNRVWAEDRLDGSDSNRELSRAREIREIVDRADYLLDLHSTSGASPPMILAGLTARSVEFARSLGLNIPMILDAGHTAGRRMRDYGPFGRTDAHQTALLVECGQHWKADTVATAKQVTQAFLSRLGMVNGPPVASSTAPVLRVTDVITVESNRFRFLSSYQGMETIAEAGTILALDGDREIRTPYDTCTLVMPTLGAGPGQTAVRLAREVPQ